MLALGLLLPGLAVGAAVVVVVVVVVARVTSSFLFARSA